MTMDNPFLPLLKRLEFIERTLVRVEDYVINLQVDQEKTETFLTKKEVMELVNCSASTVDEWLMNGKLKRYKIGRSVRYKKSDVLAWIEECKE
jgi:excisionase family DNA binding protein